MRNNKSGISGLKSSWISHILESNSSRIPSWRDVITRKDCGPMADPAGKVNPDWWYIEELFIAAQEVLNESK